MPQHYLCVNCLPIFTDGRPQMISPWQAFLIFLSLELGMEKPFPQLYCTSEAKDSYGDNPPH